MDFARRSRTADDTNSRVVEQAFVTSRAATEDGEEPSVFVSPRGVNAERRARVPMAVHGDQALPPEGTEVYITETTDGHTIIVGVTSTVDGEELDTERHIDHPYSDAEITFDEDGGIHIDGAETTTVSVSGGDLHIDADGDVFIQGINFEAHTHEFSYDGGGEDSTTLTDETNGPE